MAFLVLYGLFKLLKCTTAIFFFLRRTKYNELILPSKCNMEYLDIPYIYNTLLIVTTFCILAYSVKIIQRKPESVFQYTIVIDCQRNQNLAISKFDLQAKAKITNATVQFLSNNLLSSLQWALVLSQEIG